MGKHDGEAAGGAGAEVKALAPEVMKRVDALSELQNGWKEQRRAYLEEHKALVRKYDAIYAELYGKRAEIVAGRVDPAGAAEGAPKGIEGFWLQAMQNGRYTGNTIEEHDEPALKALTDVRCERLEDFNGFRVIFTFAPNDFFTNETLTKTVRIPDMEGNERPGFEPSVESLEGTEINWKPGKCLTYTETKKTVKKKGKKVPKVTREPQPSFFRFFDSPSMTDDAEDLSPEEAYELQEAIAVHMDVAMELHGKIVPRAVDWFTGEAAEEESDDEDEDDDYEDDDEDDEDDDEDDDEEEEERPKKGKAAKGKKGGKKGGDDDDEDDDGDDAEKEAMAKALASAFANMGKGGGKGGKKGGKKPADDEDDDEEGAAPKGGKGGAEEPPQCKQQ